MNSPAAGVGSPSSARKESSRPGCGWGVVEQVGSVLRELVCKVVRITSEWGKDKVGRAREERAREQQQRSRDRREEERIRVERERQYQERQRRQQRNERSNRHSDQSGKWVTTGKVQVQVPAPLFAACAAADAARALPPPSPFNEVHTSALVRELDTGSITPGKDEPGEGSKVKVMRASGKLSAGGMPLDQWATWQPGTHGKEETNEPDLAPGFRYVDLFSGIGCAGLALSPLNCECVLSCECDQDALAVQKSHYQGKMVEKFEDLMPEDVSDVEVAWVSCPCQSFSIAGNQGGVRDSRGTYMFRSADLLGAAQVPVLVFEMVPHFMKVERGAVARAFVGRVESHGYKVYSQVLNSVWFDAPQYRERVFYVCVLRDVVAACGEWQFPVPDSYVRPVSSVLDSEFKSAQTVPTVRSGVRWHRPVNQVEAVGTPVRVGRAGIGSRTGNYIHSIDHPICTQKSSPFAEGPGGTTGLISRSTRYGPRVTKLSVREACRCMQIPDWLDLPDGEVGYRLAGNGVCCGVLRALGRRLKTYLCALRPPRTQPTVRPTSVVAVTEVGSLTLAPISREVAAVGSWPDLMAAVRLEALKCKVSKWCGNNWWYRCRLRSLVSAVRSMRVPVALSGALIADGKARVNGWYYGGGKQLLWWEWEAELWAELREGAMCPLIGTVPAYNGRNYPSADHPKVTAEFERMVEIGAFEYVTRSKVKVITPIAAVPKADYEVSGKIRIVVDFSKSPFNENVRKMPFILPSFDDFLNEVSCGDWIGLVDFSDGFYQFPVAKCHRELLGVRLPSGKLGRFKTFPFGTRCSPWVFCRFVSYFQRQVELEYCGESVVTVVNDPSGEGYDPTVPILFKVSQGGEKLATFTIFVDDAAVCASSKSECEKAMAVYMRVAARYGLRINHSKTVWPTQTSAKFQGFIVNTVADSRGVVVTIPPEKVSTGMGLIKNMLSVEVGGTVCRRDVASLVGKLGHLTTVVKHGRAYLRRMYDCMHGDGLVGHVHDYDQHIVLSEGARVDLQWWQEHLPLVKNSLVWSSRVVTLTRQWTDASGKGFGWSKVQEGGVVRYRHGLWPTECGKYSSNARELKTILLAVSATPEEFTGCEVHSYTDNAVSASCINHSTSTSESLMALVRELVKLQLQHDFRIVAHWVPGNRGPRSMVRQGTDGLSRGSIGEGAIGGNIDPLHFMPPSPCDPVPLELVREVCGNGMVVARPDQWYDSPLSAVWCPPPSLVRRAMSVYLGQKLRMPDLRSARFVVYDFDTDPWWRWTRVGRHFKVTHRVQAQSELGLAYALPHDVLVLESPFGFWADSIPHC